MRFITLVIAIFIFMALISFGASAAKASQGLAELRSTTGEEYRCFVSSMIMQDLKFTLLISCVNLLYPADENIFRYALWANPLEGGNPVFLGDLGLGKATFRIDRPFSSLFVTTEPPGTKRPEGRVVMRGGIEPIGFLERQTTPTPTPEGEEAAPEEVQEEENLTTREKLVLALRRAGVVAFVALIALIGLVFVITRSRG